MTHGVFVRTNYQQDVTDEAPDVVTIMITGSVMIILISTLMITLIIGYGEIVP